ncbi:MAG: hypothetical protein JNL67_00235 [Planctomycetaceae bacterium]|nr:hypothetical protein [Planctomycetaceae bacterium]
MEAIIELVVALIVRPVIAVLQLAVALVAFVCEWILRLVAYVFIRWTQGSTAAGDDFRERRPVFRRPGESDLALGTEHGPPRPVHRISPIYGWIVLLFVGVTIGSVIVHYQIQQARLRHTKEQIRTLAKEVATTIRERKPGSEKLVTGPRSELDAWQRPLELFVDRWPVGTLVVVRSAGPDGQTGTGDDLLAVDGVAPPGIPGFLKKAIKERLGKILGNMELDQLPIEWVFEG